VNTAETSKVISEILTCWLLLKMFVAKSNRSFFYDPLIIFVKGKTDHHQARNKRGARGASPPWKNVLDIV